MRQVHPFVTGVFAVTYREGKQLRSAVYLEALCIASRLGMDDPEAWAEEASQNAIHAAFDAITPELCAKLYASRKSADGEVSPGYTVALSYASNRLQFSHSLAVALAA